MSHVSKSLDERITEALEAHSRAAATWGDNILAVLERVEENQRELEQRVSRLEKRCKVLERSVVVLARTPS